MGELFLDTLNELLVTSNIRVVLKLSAQNSSRVLELLCDDLNLVFGFLKLLLLRNSSELASSHDELSVLLL
jgi:hypothetical protein